MPKRDPAALVAGAALVIVGAAVAGHITAVDSTTVRRACSPPRAQLTSAMRRSQARTLRPLLHMAVSTAH
jgi:hypothetical protein